VNDAWYEEVEASASADLAQGELIPTCLIPTFSHYDPSSGKDKWVLIHYEMDLIVLTQACDLAQRHVLEPLVCSCPVLAEYKCGWEEGMRAQGQQPTTKAWNSWLGKLKNKEFPGLCFLGPYTGTVSTEDRTALAWLVRYHLDGGCEIAWMKPLQSSIAGFGVLFSI